MTLEVGSSHLIAFVGGVIALWIKNYFSAAAKEEAKIDIRDQMTLKLTKIEEALTGAKITGQLNKIDKLEEIEKRLTSAKFDVQMERIDEILKLEKTKSEGSSSIEYGYHQRKEDLEQIIVFSDKVEEATSKSASLFDEILTHKNIYKFLTDKGLLTPMNEVNSLITRVMTMYLIYFNHYDNCSYFASSLEKWEVQVKSINDMSKHTAIEILNQYQKNAAPEIIDEIQLRVSNERSEDMNKLHETKEHLLISLMGIIKEIRKINTKKLC